MNYLEKYYNDHDEQGRFDKRHNQVEFLTTMRYIEKYLPGGEGRILEIGAGTGRYSRAIADRGYSVTALELVERNIEVFKSLITPEQNIRVEQGNALDLSRFADNSFDLVLLLGPLYHLYNDEDKRRCLAEAVRVARAGGVIFAAYVISDLTLYDDAFRRGLMMISDYLDKGKIDPHTFATVSTPEDVFEMVRKEDIDRVMRGIPADRLHYVATTLVARLIREALEEMDDAAFELYMRHHFAVCERPDMAGMTSHSLDILRKREPAPCGGEPTP